VINTELGGENEVLGRGIVLYNMRRLGEFNDFDVTIN
jgi:hypothetical protein